MIWLISDTHFWHKNVIRYDKRPFEDLEDMHSKLISNWNECIKEDDTLIHLGDFAFANLIRQQEICSQLNGYKILIRGNHDRTKNFMLKAGFNEFYNEYKLVYRGYRFKLSHYPYKCKKYQHRCPVYEGEDFLIHGHNHNTNRIFKSKEINILCCLHDYMPISLDLIVDALQEEVRWTKIN
ncbi:MAG: metallophosphoesterase family protein [Candidatus Heimdallarchaeaceae archaeon]